MLERPAWPRNKEKHSWKLYLVTRIYFASVFRNANRLEATNRLILVSEKWIMKYSQLWEPQATLSKTMNYFCKLQSWQMKANIVFHRLWLLKYCQNQNFSLCVLYFCYRKIYFYYILHIWLIYFNIYLLYI